MALTTVPDKRRVRAPDEPPMLIKRHLNCFEATGTVRQLTQAAICVPSQLPQGRKRTAYERLPDGRFMTMEKKPGNRWRVTVAWTDAEREAVRESVVRSMPKESMPKTAEQWRHGHASAAATITEMLIKMAQGSDGYCLSPEAMRQIHAMASRINMVFRHAPVVATSKREQPGDTCDMEGPMASLGPHLRLVQK